MPAGRDDDFESTQRRCGGCGYPLEGLPPEGRCPKCGSEYHPLQVVLWGRGRGEWDTLNVAGTIVGLGVVTLLMIFAIGTRMPEELRPFAVAGTLIAAATGLACWIWVRWNARRETGEPEQIRLEPRGFARRAGPGASDLQPPLPSHIVELRRYDFGQRMIVRVSWRWYRAWLWRSDLLHADVACDEDTWQRAVQIVRGWNVGELTIRDPSG